MQRDPRAFLWDVRDVAEAIDEFTRKINLSPLPEIGFEGLAAELGKSSKSLQRMLGSSGNPTAENLLAILKVLQEHEAVHIKVKITREAA